MSDKKKTPEDKLLDDYRRAQKHIVNTVKRSVSDSPDEVIREVESAIRIELHKVTQKNAAFIQAIEPTPSPPRTRIRQDMSNSGMITRSAYIELNSALSAASEDLMARLRKSVEPMRNQVTSFYDIKRVILDDFRSAGVLNVTYKNGHKVTLDKYVEMVTTSARNETDNDEAEKRAKEAGSDYVYMAPARNACNVCGSKGDRVYCISGRDPEFPKVYGDLWEGQYKTIHPNCRCRLVPWHKEQYTDKELKRLTESSQRPFVGRDGKPLDVQPEAARKQYIEQQTFNRKVWQEQSEYEYYKSRYGSQFPYTTLSGYRRARRADSSKLTDWLDKHTVQQTTEGPTVRTGNSPDKRQYESWMDEIGYENMPNSLDKFRKMKDNDTEEYMLLRHYRHSRVKGDISALSSFNNFKKTQKSVTEISVGKTAANGVNITSVSLHGVDRVIGTIYKLPNKHEGMSLEEFENILFKGTPGKIRTDSQGRKSQKILIDGLGSISVNPDTGEIIQCNKI